MGLCVCIRAGGGGGGVRGAGRSKVLMHEFSGN